VGGRRLQLGVASLGLFLAALDTYAVVTLLPQMLAGVDLPIDRVESATPILSGFLGGYVVAMPLLGAFSDARGRLPAYTAAMLVFLAGSTLTALSASLPLMVTGRSLQGLGGGALVPLSLALAADLYATGRRAVPVGAVSAVQEAGSVFGPIYGAVLAAVLASWRGVFWLNLPLGALVLAGMWATSRRAEVPAPRPRSAGGGVELAGAALLGLSLGLLVFALYPDDPSHRAVNSNWVPLLAASAVAMTAFGLIQARRLRPLVAPGLGRSPRFWASIVANLLAGAALMVALVDVPLLARAAFRLDTLGAGLLLTRMLVGVPVGALAGGLISRRLGRRWTAAGGLALAALTFVLISRWATNELQTAPLAAYAELFAAGLGFGLVIAPLTSAVLDLTSAGEHGLASSFVILARTLGMVVGLSSLTAFGLARFQAIFSAQRCSSLAVGGSLQDRLNAFENCAREAVAQEYREIFLAAAMICAVATLVVVLGFGGGELSRPRAPQPAVQA
jgi:MFS family permease